MASPRLPDLGRRGEGWFLLQLVFFGAIAVSGFTGPAWSGWPLAAGIALGGVLVLCGGILALRGVLDLRDIVYYASVITFMLFATHVVLNNRKTA